MELADALAKLAMDPSCYYSPSTSSSASILDLPELPLLTIFDHLPLANLVHMDEVCRAWGGALKAAALARRTTLIIVHRPTDLRCLETVNCSFDMMREVFEDDGKTPFLKKRTNLVRHALYSPPAMQTAFLDQVTSLLPGIKSLFFLNFDGEYSDLWPVKCLLAHYRHQLVQLTLWYWASMTDFSYGGEDAGEEYEPEVESYEATQQGFRVMYGSLCSTLNSLTALKHLSLNIQMPLGMSAPEGTLRLSVARQLQSLNVRASGFSEDHRDALVLKSTLERYCEANPTLQEIYTENPLHLDTGLAYGPRVAAAMRQVHLEDPLSKQNMADFRRFAARFTNITDLTLTAVDVSLAEVVRPLAASCQALVHLTVSANFDPVQRRVTPANDLPVGKLPVLPSVKALSLFIETANHRDFDKFNLDNLFPNTQVILLRHSFARCTECSFALPPLEMVVLHGDERLRKFSRLAHECMRRARLPFARLGQLRVLRANLGLGFTSEGYGCVLNADGAFSRTNLDRETFFLEGVAAREGAQAKDVVAAAARKGLQVEVLSMRY